MYRSVQNPNAKLFVQTASFVEHDLDENNYCLGGCYLDQACAQWVDDSHCPVLYCVKQDLDENNHYRAAGYDAK